MQKLSCVYMMIVFIAEVIEMPLNFGLEDIMVRHSG